MYGDYDLGITTITMLLVLRLMSLSWCYKDGAADPSTLTERQKRIRLVQLPSMFEVMSYTFTHLAACIAIFFEFTDYRNFIELKHEYKKLEPSKCLWPGIKYYLASVVCAILNLVFNSYFDVNIAFQDEFGTWSFTQQAFLAWGHWGISRSMYYTAFLWNESSAILSGFSYDGENKDGSIRFDKIVGCNYWMCEFCTNTTEFSNNWNF